MPKKRNYSKDLHRSSDRAVVISDRFAPDFYELRSDAFRGVVIKFAPADNPDRKGKVESLFQRLRPFDPLRHANKGQVPSTAKSKGDTASRGGRRK